MIFLGQNLVYFKYLTRYSAMHCRRYSHDFQHLVILYLLFVLQHNKTFSLYKEEVDWGMKPVNTKRLHLQNIYCRSFLLNFH